MYLFISQSVIYLEMRPDSSQLAKALPEALCYHTITLTILPVVNRK